MEGSGWLLVGKGMILVLGSQWGRAHALESATVGDALLLQDERLDGRSDALSEALVFSTRAERDVKSDLR